MSRRVPECYSYTNPFKRRWAQAFASSLAVISLLGLVAQKSLAMPSGSFRPKAPVVQEKAVQTLAALTQNTFSGRYKALTPDGQGIITYTEMDRRSHLYTINGNEQATFEGEFQAFTLDRQGLFTYNDGRTRLYTLDGEEKATFEGAPISFTPDQQGVLVSDDFGGTVRMIGGIFPTRLYRLDGVEQAVFPGRFEAFMPDGKGLIATCTCHTGLVSRIFSLDGTEQATLQGLFVAFSPDEQKIITTDYNHARIYRLDGSLQTVLRGQFENVSPPGLSMGLPNIVRSSGFTPDSQGLITSNEDTSWLYSFDGDLQHVFRGRFWNFTPNDAGLITYTFNQQSWLYDLDGTLQATFEGRLLGFTPDEMGLIVQLHNQSSQLYDLKEDSQRTFAGSFLTFTPDGQGLITNSSGADGYHSSLYDLSGGDPTVLEGLFLGFAVNQQRLVTSFEGLYGPYSLYRPDGTFHTTSEIWPRLTPDRRGFIAVVDRQSQLYDLDDGRVKATFVGTFQSFIDDGQGLVTYSAADGQSRLYRLNSQL
ncbi:MAG: WD40 repeat domain-containing protein [Phormidesmis sp.]